MGDMQTQPYTTPRHRRDNAAPEDAMGKEEKVSHSPPLAARRLCSVLPRSFDGGGWRRAIDSLPHHWLSTVFDCLLAAIQNRHDPKLKFKCIAFDEGTIQRIDTMVKREVLTY